MVALRAVWRGACGAVVLLPLAGALVIAGAPANEAVGGVLVVGYMTGVVLGVMESVL